MRCGPMREEETMEKPRSWESGMVVDTDGTRIPFVDKGKGAISLLMERHPDDWGAIVAAIESLPEGSVVTVDGYPYQWVRIYDDE